MYITMASKRKRVVFLTIEKKYEIIKSDESTMKLAKMW